MECCINVCIEDISNTTQKVACLKNYLLNISEQQYTVIKIIRITGMELDSLVEIFGQEIIQSLINRRTVIKQSTKLSDRCLSTLKNGRV
jgi:hypothetical protein